MNTNNNYNLKTEFVQQNTKKNKYLIDEVAVELKIKLKNLLNMTRIPRDLNLFCIFFKAYQLQKTTNQPVFISTNLIKNSFGVKVLDYKKYFDEFVAEWEDETYSVKEKRCRRIKSFNQQFIDLCEEYSDLKLNSDFYKKYYYSVTMFSKHQLSELNRIFKSRREEREEQSISGTLRSDEFEDIISEDFYHSTEDSPFRKYHKLQSLTRTTKSQIFDGYYDIDLQQCFASIAWNILDMQNCNLSFAWMLNPIFKNDLRKKVQSDFGLETIEEAKQKICALFTEAWTTGEKNVEWYNQLHFEIKKRVKKHLGQNILWNGKEVLIDTMHKFFTYHEQMIITKLSEECNVVLNMHDGIIATNKPSADYVEYLGFKFLLSINQFVKIEFIKDEQAIIDLNMMNEMIQTNGYMMLNKNYKEAIDNIGLNIKREISHIISV